jgi:hypothetical protein
MPLRNAKPLPGIFIYKEVVNQRVKNFMEKKHPMLSAAIGKEDSRSGWYSLRQFEELMREMYYLNADGVRIYFGAHDSNDPLYPDQLTVIFVPTCLNEAGDKHVDIVIEEEENFEKRADTYVKTAGLPTEQKNLDTVWLCPPTCDDQGFAYPH